MNVKLEFTGERFIPDRIFGDIQLEHFHRYLLASQLVDGKVVLDIACGDGYGSAILAKHANKVIGVDIAEEAVNSAKLKHQAENLEFSKGSCSAIPMGDASVDIVVSFETIEHHDEHEQMMMEIKRVLKKDGVLIISSPDKFEYSDKPKYKNKFHVKELYRHEFLDLLSRYFKYYDLYSQKISFGSLILREGSDGPMKSWSTDDGQQYPCDGVPGGLYLIAVASNYPTSPIYSGIFSTSVSQSDLARERSGNEQRLEDAVKVLKEAVDGLIIERDSLMDAVKLLKEAVDGLIIERDSLKVTLKNSSESE